MVRSSFGVTKTLTVVVKSEFSLRVLNRCKFFERSNNFHLHLYNFRIPAKMLQEMGRLIQHKFSAPINSYNKYAVFNKMSPTGQCGEWVIGGTPIIMWDTFVIFHYYNLSFFITAN